ncbi:MAG TPA: DUF6588 family protein [Chitinispirillaceae bacterium]|nr:DUF6588 family protein [Chitinispirillaceae bacterium]
MRFVLKTVLIPFILTSTLYAGRGSSTMHSINEQPGYMRPFATSVGTLTNSGWLQSASIERDFGFSFSLPISLAYIGKKDRQYSESYTNHETGTSVNVTVPTVFGSMNKPIVYHGTSQNIPDSTTFRPGLEEFQTLSVLPYITLQASFSFYYTELKLRYIGLPLSNNSSFYFPGIGLQHDLHHFFPSSPVAVSLAGNITFLNASFTPGDRLEGTLTTGGISSFLGVAAGYRPSDKIELFLETGWDHCHVSAKGSIISSEDDTRETIPVDNKITGRNAFRIALNVAVPLKYNPVAGVIAGAQWGNMINLISFRSKQN